jgi:hypothetical protein
MRFSTLALSHLLWAGALLGCQPAADQQVTASPDQPAATPADSAAPVAAQAPAGSGPAVLPPAAVVTVAAGKDDEEFGRFELPQVQLPDAAVAERLNRAIVAASFENEADWQQLSARQAVQRCLREYRAADGQGLTSLSYVVVHNEHGLLTVAQTSEFLGAYPSSDTRSLVFDVRTGRRLRMADLVRDTVALRNHWRAAISQRVAAHLRAAPRDFADDTALVRELPELLHWNAATRQVAFEANEPSFYDFAVTRRGLTLTYSYGLPHAIQAVEPETGFSFTFAELRSWLRTDGPLAALLAAQH